MDLDELARKLDDVVILGEDSWKAIVLGLVSPYAPRILFNGIEIRNNLHVLLTGDVSSAKSQVLNIIKKIAPKWELISKATEPSIEGSAVTSDIKPGILERVSEGVLVIPEFQNAYYSHMQILREALDCSEIRVFKKGKARIFTPNVTLMSACNPADDFFISGLRLRDQIKFKEGILSRFDVLIPTLATPELNQKVVDHAVLFGASSTGADWGKLQRFFVETARKMRNVQHVKISKAQEQRLKDTFLQYNKKQLAKRPFLILRDLETLMRLVNVYATFMQNSTPAVDATDSVLDAAILLWEHLLTLREEFYNKTSRQIQTLPEQILQVLTGFGGSAKVEDVKGEVCHSKQLCSEATFYRKLQRLREDGQIKHSKGAGATVEIIALSSYKEEKPE